MNMPRHINVKPNQVATLAWVVLQIGVALAVDADFSMSVDRENRAAGNDTGDDQRWAMSNREIKAAGRNSRQER
jgi:hypothetical protein